MRDFPFGIIYKPLPELTLIITFMHLKRKPGYWRKRMNPGA